MQRVTMGLDGLGTATYSYDKANRLPPGSAGRPARVPWAATRPSPPRRRTATPARTRPVPLAKAPESQ
jgi:hypothetical protein